VTPKKQGPPATTEKYIIYKPYPLLLTRTISEAEKARACHLKVWSLPEIKSSLSKKSDMQA
jgi:hypothetical protein